MEFEINGNGFRSKLFATSFVIHSNLSPEQITSTITAPEINPLTDWMEYTEQTILPIENGSEIRVTLHFQKAFKVFQLLLWGSALLVILFCVVGVLLEWLTENALMGILAYMEILLLFEIFLAGMRFLKLFRMRRNLTEFLQTRENS